MISLKNKVAIVTGASKSTGIGIPEDAAITISFLASDESQWITGQVIKSEGGFLGK